MKVTADDFPLKEEGYAILGAVFEVYKEMGCGLGSVSGVPGAGITFAFDTFYCTN